MKTCLITLCLLLVAMSTFGTHLRAGYISVKRVHPTDFTYVITVHAYLNTKNTPVKFGGDVDISYVNFGDGESLFVPEADNIIRYDLDPSGSLAEASFTSVHTYEGPGTYTIWYREPNRNGGILNMSNSLTTLFYIETNIVVGSAFVSTPEILAYPIFLAAKGDDFSYSLAAKDSIDQSLFYELVPPQRDLDEPVSDYELPENFSINTVNGLIGWDTKFNGVYAPGEYAFAARIYIYDEDVALGYMLFDFQIILEDDGSDPESSLVDNKDFDGNGRIHVPLEGSQKFKVFAEDASAASIELVAYTELNETLLPQDAFSFSAYDSVEGARTIRVGFIEIKNSAAVDRSNPYAIVVRAYFNRPAGRVGIKKDLGYLFYTKNNELEVPDLHPDPVLGIAENENSFLVYPNPVKNLVFVDEKVRSAGLITPDGKRVLDFDCKEGSIDLTQVQPGIYLLQLKSGGSSKTVVRIIKE